MLAAWGCPTRGHRGRGRPRSSGSFATQSSSPGQRHRVGLEAVEHAAPSASRTSSVTVVDLVVLRVLLGEAEVLPLQLDRGDAGGRRRARSSLGRLVSWETAFIAVPAPSG